MFRKSVTGMGDILLNIMYLYNTSVGTTLVVDRHMISSAWVTENDTYFSAQYYKREINGERSITDL